jgi:tRNA(fMet)-specific endonuclease VapC
MRRYLLDTGIASDYINRRNNVFRRAKEEVARGNRVGIGMPILGELFAGIELSASREKNLKKLLQVIRVWTIWPFERGAAEEFGRLFAELRRRGRSMQGIDIQIAAIAINLGNCTVVSSDTDLSAVPGLAVENWAT